MLKSRDISDYVEAKLSELRPGAPIGFDVHLYMTQNHHILVWRRSGDVITDGFLDKYRERGVEKIWIHNTDMEAYYRYLNPEAETESGSESETVSGSVSVSEAVETPSPSDTDTDTATDSPPYLTPEGETLSELMNHDDVNEREKIALIAKSARAILSLSASAGTIQEQRLADQKARNVVHDILGHAATQVHSVSNEIWRLSDVDPALEHSVNVATYAVIFAMAFGRIDRDLIGDIALAGLLHDIGVSQVSSKVTASPWKSLKGDTLREYATHVDATLVLIQTYAPEISDRIKAIISQQHEKFDGTGYPRGLQGFRVDDISQLLAIADLLDSISHGRWDGTERTLRDTFETLESLEKARTFPEHFNPEVFSAVIRWIKNHASIDSAEAALKIVEQQVRVLVQAKVA